jgi:Zn-dependent protease with chaperone function
MPVSLSSIYRISEFRKALPKIDKIHGEIKRILANKTPTLLTKTEQKQISKLLEELRQIITDTFKIEVVNIIIVESKAPNAMVAYDKFLIPFSNQALIVYIDKLFHILSPKELTAVLLHEIGHTYYWFPVFLRTLLHYSNIATLIVAPFLHLGLSIALFVISWLLSLKFSRIAEEYADRFVAELGYHKYLISAFDKFQKYAPELLRKAYITAHTDESDNNEESKQKEEKNALIEFFKIILSTHPRFEDRICNIVHYTYEIAREKYGNNPKVLKKIKEQLKEILKKHNLQDQCPLK